jgi:hypothetical protein
MYKKVFVYVFVMMAVVLGNGIISSTARADTSHCGTLALSETWSAAGSVHVVTCTVTVPIGVSLTIDPGAIVKFAGGSQLIVNGTLDAVGTQANRIYFTSIKDDAVGGDTNGDGTGSSPAKGDWNGVATGSGSSVTLDYLTLRYTGNGGRPALEAGGYAIPVVGDNVALTDNVLNGIQIPSGSVSVSLLDIPYYPAAAYYIPGSLTIPDGAKVTVEPGAIVKFAGGSQLIVNGTLDAVGTQANRIYLTSIKDDAVGGDTNGNGAGSSPAKGDWNGVVTGLGSSVTLDYLTLRYTGNGGRPALEAGGYAIPVVGDNVALTDNVFNGIQIPSGSVSVSLLDIPYYPAAAYYIPGSLTIPDGAKVTVEPGAIVKFAGGSQLIVNGTLDAVGTQANRIYFTSIKDDAVGGDTNGNGAGSSPAKGDWNGVVTGLGSSVTLDYLTLRYTGNGGRPALDVDKGVASISNAVLTKNYIGLRANIAGITIHNSEITNNTAYGVENDLAGTWLDATNNWWGDASGPKDIGNADGSNNPNGRGDQVTDWVAYSPWTFPSSSSLFLPLIR